MHHSCMRATIVAVAGLAFCAGSASAQIGYSTDFNNLDANPQGVILTGQDGFFLPVAGSTDFEVVTYTANSYAFPQNPTGGANFIAGIGEGGGTFERAERAVNFGAGEGLWELSFDVIVSHRGPEAPIDNIGSVSLQPGTNQSFIASARWSSGLAGEEWNADYIWFDENGTQFFENVPDAGFQNLETDQWYRWTTLFDMTSNRITEVSIEGLTVSHSASFEPTDRYLFGGSAGADLPEAVRFFTGSSNAGNVMGFDNLTLIPAPGTVALLALGGLVGLRRRR